MFQADAPAAIEALMPQLAPKVGWLVLQPGADEDSLPPGRATARMMTRRPPLVPICSWVPGERTRNGIDHVALGIEHARGSKALEGVGVEVPPGWEVMQDNQKRGLIVAAPPHEAHAAVLRWLLDAGAALSRLELTGEWRALVYRRCPENPRNWV